MAVIIVAVLGTATVTLWATTRNPGLMRELDAAKTQVTAQRIALSAVRAYLAGVKDVSPQAAAALDILNNTQRRKEIEDHGE